MQSRPLATEGANAANVSPPIDIDGSLENARVKGNVAQSQAVKNPAAASLGRATELRGVDIGNDFRMDSEPAGTNVTASHAYPAGGNKLGTLSEEQIAERE